MDHLAWELIGGALLVIGLGGLGLLALYLRWRMRKAQR
jgi:hypothetical protein